MEMNNPSKFHWAKKPVFVMTVWFGVVFAYLLLRIPKGAHNNFLIFSQSFEHFLSHSPLYIPYPHEYLDLYLYGVPFALLMAPFSLFSPLIGSLIWCLANSYLLYFAIKKLGFDRWKFAFVICFSVNELFTALITQQFNIGLAGLIILSFVFIEGKKEFWAAFFIVIGTMTKVYGIVGLAFLMFSKKKLSLLLWILCWSTFLFILPMVFTSPQYVIGEYNAWFHTLTTKNELNTFSGHTNISLLGMVRKITNISTYSDLWIIIPGLLLFAAPYLRFKQYANKSFRLMFLSSALLFMVLFSTGTESYGYITAMVAVGIWYVNTPSNVSTPLFNKILLVFCFILTSLSPTDVFPRFLRVHYVIPYALKALPCVLIWFKIVWDQLTLDFTEPSQTK